MMTARMVVSIAFTAALALNGVRPAGADVGLAPEVVQALEQSPYVYVATQRKDGTFSPPAEIWFMWDQGAVWMASPATTWRAKRIRAGRGAARIFVGRKDGPMITATGSFVRDPAAYERLYATYAKKYPDGWPRYEAKFREGLKDGSRVLMRYQPIAGAAVPSPSPAK
jgi:predicted pyridoxine 5'-phosphate oxidase superfamily flavin-nucleotide-binding protein